MNKKRIVLFIIICVIVLLIFGIFTQRSKSKIDADNNFNTNAVEEKTDNEKINEAKPEKDDASKSKSNINENDSENIKKSDVNVKNTEGDTVKVKPQKPNKEITSYEKYQNMTAEEQKAFYNSFDNDDAFFEWYNNAKEEYNNSRNETIIDGNTNIELE